MGRGYWGEIGNLDYNSDDNLTNHDSFEGHSPRCISPKILTSTKAARIQTSLF